MDSCVLLKLRENITVEDDVQLALLEARALFHGPVAACATLDEALDLLALPHVAGPGLAQPGRGCGPAALTAGRPRRPLAEVARRLTFAQEMLICGPSADLAAAHDACPWNSRLQARDGRSLLRVIPHFCIAELADVIARQASRFPDPATALDRLLEHLLADDPSQLAPDLDDLPLRQASTCLGHSLHVYKSKFFPRVVRSLANGCLPDLHACCLLDPFAGSGTSLLEGQALGLAALGTDLDPLSVAISETKLSLARVDAQALGAALQGIRAQMREAAPLSRLQRVELPWALARKLEPEEAERINGNATAIKSAIYAGDEEPLLRQVLLISLSDALARKLRLRFLGTGHGRFAIELRKTALADLFFSHVQRMIRAIQAIQALERRLGPAPAAACFARMGDALDIAVPPSSVDLIITSPPYLPAASGRENYTLGKAASLLALDLLPELELKSLNDALVGSMAAPSDLDAAGLPDSARAFVEWLRNDPGRNIKADPSLRYYQDVKRALQEMQRVLRPGAVAAVVVARSHTFYRYATREVLYTAQNAEIIEEIARGAGLGVDRVLHLKLNKHNAVARPRSRDAYYESILLLRKPPDSEESAVKKC